MDVIWQIQWTCVERAELHIPQGKRLTEAMLLPFEPHTLKHMEGGFPKEAALARKIFSSCEDLQIVAFQPTRLLLSKSRLVVYWSSILERVVQILKDEGYVAEGYTFRVQPPVLTEAVELIAAHAAQLSPEQLEKLVQALAYRQITA